MPRDHVRNPILPVIEIDLLIRQAVIKSWEVQSILATPSSAYYRGDVEQVSRKNVQSAVERQINARVERALKDLGIAIQEYNVEEYSPGCPGLGGEL